METKTRVTIYFEHEKFEYQAVSNFVHEAAGEMLSFQDAEKGGCVFFVAKLSGYEIVEYESEVV